ncbi:penicillin-binding protein activator LpoB [Treponema sp.]|uniref:penicillin-binding protein activator LpoB n=1 Tax=Treponema sp. TaxID=166 RepID=UPI00298E55ED|nr:penicillin-binding protein activator LpoB [Treponema sp.]MCQ2242358.1 penicillin-binding protein activator LpoB [Treponema sp.]
MKKIILAMMLAAAAMGAFALGKTKVKRVSSDKVIDLDGYWNDTDVRIVCESLIEECVNSPRIAKFEEENGRPGLVIVGKIVNGSNEHIDTSIIEKRLRSAIINSGVLEFVVSKDEREQLRDEKIDQEQHASLETAKAMDNEAGADFMLTGTVKSIVQTEGKKSVRAYFVNVTLSSIETNRIIWQGENDEIKKEIKNQKKK